MTTLATLLSQYSVTLSGEGADRCTNRALPRAEAAALRQAAEQLGYEASDAPDNDDRSVSWVYIAGER